MKKLTCLLICLFLEEMAKIEIEEIICMQFLRKQ